MYLKQANKIARDVGQGKISLAQDGLRQRRGLRPRLFRAVLPWLYGNRKTCQKYGFQLDGRTSQLVGFNVSLMAL